MKTLHADMRKIDRMRYERGWSFYKLAKLSGVGESTINRWANANVSPTIDALRKICKAFGITLADFFCEGTLIELTTERKEFHDKWTALSPNQQQAVMSIVNGYLEDK